MEQVNQIVIHCNDNQARDYTAVYEYIASNYDNQEGVTPIIIFASSCEPILLKDETGYVKNEIAIIDRNAPDTLRTLKKTLRKEAVKTNIGGLKSLTSDYDNYYTIYSATMMVCKELNIPAPAVFICDRMPDKDYERGGIVTLNKDGICTDIILSGKRCENINPQNSDFADSESQLCLREIKTLCHELRHVWQHKYHEDWFNDYDMSLVKTDLDRYSKQKVEIDANAYAFFWCEEVFDVDYLMLYEYSAEQKQMLRQRISEIKAERQAVK